MTHRHALNADHPAVELARRVLGADKVGRDLNNAASWDAVDLVLENAPALAEAVLRAAALADALDSEADLLRGMGAHATDHGLYAHRIRAALNGDPQ